MTRRNMTVKHGYYCGSVALVVGGVDNARMENLRAIRKAKKMSQEDLAEASGVSQGAISKIERGEMNITLETITQIAKALDVHPVQLFPLPELQRRALDAIQAIDPARQDAALTVLEAMVSPRR
jgi:transcriptional regulator with XRE-family HTH domain